VPVINASTYKVRKAIAGLSRHLGGSDDVRWPRDVIPYFGCLDCFSQNLFQFSVSSVSILFDAICSGSSNSIK
jgi:hypothetical protein